MNTLTDKKAIADFKKKHLDASRERWVKSVEAKAKRLQKPQLASLEEALKGKKKPDSQEQEILKAVKELQGLAEKVEKIEKTIAEIGAPVRPTIAQIARPVAGPADVIKVLAAGLLLWQMARKAADKAEKESKS